MDTTTNVQKNVTKSLKGGLTYVMENVKKLGSYKKVWKKENIVTNSGFEPWPS